ncbi:hypothetical protein [Dactylosporangium sp. CA-139066]|uniref:hypothetical protein n=1 Tax=Dactylosporangium sp. CA-139066 TaxID=3239930 RepID=UPI003D8C0121
MTFDSMALGRRFFVVGYLPTYTAAVFLLLLIWAGAPGALHFSAAWRAAGKLTAGDLLLLLAAVVSVGLILQPLQLVLLRLLEGYWPARLSGPPRRRQLRRRARLAAAAALPERPEDLAAEEVNRIGLAGTRLRLRYPAADQVRATALGNALAAAEGRAGARFGWDAVVAWPRLYPLLGDRTRTIVDDRRDTVDAAARLAVVAALTTVVTVALLGASGGWIALTLVPLAVSWLSYRGAVQAAIAYGESVEVAFDLHRFDLLAALHLPLPADTEAEARLAAELSALWRQGKPVPLTYTHPA